MDGALRIERVVLLGLITLLGATGTLFTALSGLAISAGAALAVCAADLALRAVAAESPAARWALLISVGFLVSWALTAMAPFVVAIPDGAMLFLRLAGVSPIVFFAVGANRSARESLTVWVQFGVLMLAAGTVRELFGRGTLAGYLSPGGFTIPADFFASPMGAFLVVAAVVLGARITANISQGRATNNGAANGGER